MGLFIADTARTRSVSTFSTADTSGLAAFRGSIPWILPVHEVCQGSVLLVLLVMQVMAILRPLVLLVLLVLVVPKYSQCAQCTRSTKYTWTICAPFRSFHPHFFLENIQRVRVVSNFFLGGGAIGVLESVASISGV